MSNKKKNNAAHSIVITLQLPNIPGSFMKVAKVIGEAGADLDIVEMLSDSGPKKTRRVHVFCSSLEHEKEVAASVRRVEGVDIAEITDSTFEYHNHGKMEIASLNPLETKNDLSIAYTPGVARPCMAIHDNVEQAYNLTIKGNTVAVVSDGTAVLGLGDIGPEAAMPVMEGKCLLFKRFAGVDAIPLCIDTKDPQEIIKFVKNVAPTFGGINLEDISAPRCFEVEDTLKKELNIPVFHDDQHGTAIVTLAALLNALKVTGKKIESLKCVICGIGSAGNACAKILMEAGLKNIIGVNTKGAVNKDTDTKGNSGYEWFAANTNPDNISGSLSEVIKGADLFLGLSAPGVLTVDDIKNMNPDPIVFAMANPTPEIMPEVAGDHVAVMATGRSDYPNQINNVLAFPGIFRGALDCRASAITENMKLAAAKAIAEIVDTENLSKDYIIPSPLDERVAPAVAKAVKECAIEEGIGQIQPEPLPSFAELNR